MTPILEAQSIGKSFGTRRVLAGANLVVGAGRITALVGRMGEGKSTLLRICCGVTTPDYGSIRFDQTLYERPRLHELAAKGLYFLDADGSLSPQRSLREHLELFRSTYGHCDDELLDILGLTDLQHVPIRKLSTGERRRGEIAIAVARNPRCLVADEPYRGLDPLSVEKLHAVFRKLASSGAGLLITGQQIATVLDIADEVVWLTSGTTLPLGAPSSALNDDSFVRDLQLRTLSRASAEVMTGMTSNSVRSSQ